MTARYETIARWANELGWTKGAELGVFDGRTHFYLLDRCPQLHLIGVDVWDTPGFNANTKSSGERCFCPYCSETRGSRRTRTIKQMREHVFAHADKTRSTLFIAETAKVAEQVEDGSLDFVFIDADHSLAGVTADIEAWRSKVREGGRLIGHDYNFESVRSAVLSVFDVELVNVADDHIWWVTL